MPAEWEVITRFDSTSGLSLSKLHATTDAHSSMHCLRVPACFAVVLGIVATCSLAEETESELTADEFVVNAASLYANGRYNEAAELYRKFIADFGSSPDAETAIKQTYYPLAMCLLRLQRFPEAYQAIKDAFGKNLDLDRSQ